jgi:hypothetical protein
MDQSNSPPVPHMLRPHHVGILLFLIVYYRGLDWGEKGQPPRPLQKKVKQRMLVVLAREIGEVSACASVLVLSCGPNVDRMTAIRKMEPPTPYAELVAKIDMETDDTNLKQEFFLLRYTLTEVV